MRGKEKERFIQSTWARPESPERGQATTPILSGQRACRLRRVVHCCGGARARAVLVAVFFDPSLMGDVAGCASIVFCGVACGRLVWRGVLSANILTPASAWPLTVTSPRAKNFVERAFRYAPPGVVEVAFTLTTSTTAATATVDAPSFAQNSCYRFLLDDGERRGADD